MLRIEREHTITLDPYEELANAIVEQAAKDYREMRRKLKRNPNDMVARGQMGEVVRFFHSRWFGILTDANPDYILEQLKEEN